jgi:hypothetical protein
LLLAMERGRDFIPTLAEAVGDSRMTRTTALVLKILRSTSTVSYWGSQVVPGLSMSLQIRPRFKRQALTSTYIQQASLRLHCCAGYGTLRFDCNSSYQAFQQLLVRPPLPSSAGWRACVRKR